MELTLGEIAAQVDARLVGDAGLIIRNVSGIREAGEGDITFLANPRYHSYLETTHASAVIVDRPSEHPQTAELITPDPYQAFRKVLVLFDRTPDGPAKGTDPNATVAPDVDLGQDVAIGAHAVLDTGARIGDRTEIMAGCYVGHRTRIGADCRIYPNVVIREDIVIGDRVILHPGVVIGSCGFGFAPDADGNLKIPQIGTVIIEDDVEIGSNSTIDRATLGATKIGQGTRIDNLVHVAHNVEIGAHSILCALVGIAGSARLGKQVIMGGQSGTVGHIEIGDQARVAAQGGVTKSVPSGRTVSGYPARDHAKAQRAYASLRQLPNALRTLREIERRLTALQEKIEPREEKEDLDS